MFVYGTIKIRSIILIARDEVSGSWPWGRGCGWEGRGGPAAGTCWDNRKSEGERIGEGLRMEGRCGGRKLGGMKGNLENPQFKIGNANCLPIDL